MTKLKYFQIPKIFLICIKWDCAYRLTLCLLCTCILFTFLARFSNTALHRELVGAQHELLVVDCIVIIFITTVSFLSSSSSTVIHPSSFFARNAHVCGSNERRRGGTVSVPLKSETSSGRHSHASNRAKRNLTMAGRSVAVCGGGAVNEGQKALIAHFLRFQSQHKMQSNHRAGTECPVLLMMNTHNRGDRRDDNARHWLAGLHLRVQIFLSQAALYQGSAVAATVLHHCRLFHFHTKHT